MPNTVETATDVVSKNPFNKKIVVGVAAAIVATGTALVIARLKKNSEGTEVVADTTVEA